MPQLGIQVAAVLETRKAAFTPGVNIETLPGADLCAPKGRGGRAVSSGGRASGGYCLLPGRDSMPCGSCRQFLAEFCREDFQVLVAGRDDPPGVYLLGELLPHGFTLNTERKGRGAKETR